MPEEQKDLNQTPDTPDQPLQTQPQPTGDISNQAPSLRPPTSHKLIVLLVIGLLIIGVVAAAVLLSKKPKTISSSTSLTKISVRLNWLHQAQFAGMYVAKDKGFYKAAGLDVNIKEYQDGLDQNKEVADQSVNFAVTTAPEVVSSIDSGYKIRAVAAIDQTSPSIIVSAKSSNIKTPADFKGKVLGSVGGNKESKAIYGTLMSAVGLTPSQATIKDIDFDIVKDLQTHAADTTDPYRTDQTFQLDKAGVAYNTIYPEQFGFDIYGDVIIASDSEITNQPTQVKKFVSATLEGWSYALDHQDETLTITAKYQNKLYDDVAYEKHILTNYVPLIRPTGGQAVGTMQFVPWNRAYQSMKNAGLLKTQLDPSQLYTSQFVK